MPPSLRPDIVQAMSQGLVQARRNQARFQPPASAHDLSTEEAYAVQAQVAKAMGWFATRPSAWKAGGAPIVSAAPLPAAWPDGHHWAPPRWTNAAPDNWIVEAELAFTLGEAPGANASAAEVLACLDTVAVAIEAIDTRLAPGLQSPAAWKLADQGVHGCLAVGAAVPAAPLLARSTDEWAAQAWSIEVNNQPAATARGGLPAVSPLGAIVWLAAHAAAHTGGLRAGDVVSTGAWGVVRAGRGDAIRVHFDGLGTATLLIN